MKIHQLGAFVSLSILSIVAASGAEAQAALIADPSKYTAETFISDGVLSSPSAIAFDSIGRLYVVDAGHFVIRRFDATGNGRIFAGVNDRNEKYVKINTPKKERVAGNCYNTEIGDSCLATQAIFSNPKGIVIDRKGNVFISDTAASRIRKIDARTGKVTTYAGGGGAGWGPTQLHNPAGMAIDNEDNIYVADKANNAIRKISPPLAGGKRGRISTVAGLGPDRKGCSTDGSVALQSPLNRVTDVTIDSFGNLYVADTGCRRIRKISTSGIISTVAGTGKDHEGTPPRVPFSGTSGRALEMNLGDPVDVMSDRVGNLLISDSGFNVVWSYQSASGELSILAGTGPVQSGATFCANSTDSLGDGCKGNEAALNIAGKPALDSVGNIYIPETGGTKSPSHPFDIRVWRLSGN